MRQDVWERYLSYFRDGLSDDFQTYTDENGWTSRHDFLGLKEDYVSQCDFEKTLGAGQKPASSSDDLPTVPFDGNNFDTATCIEGEYALNNPGTFTITSMPKLRFIEAYALSESERLKFSGNFKALEHIGLGALAAAAGSVEITSMPELRILKFSSLEISDFITDIEFDISGVSKLG